MLLSALLVVVASVLGSAEMLPLPPRRYVGSQSFRGLSSGGIVQNYDVSGHTVALPGVHDFIRLVPPTPLAHGSVFARLPMPMKEWTVDIAFRVHGPHDEMDASQDRGAHGKMSNRGGRGLGFWYTKERPKGAITITSDPTFKVYPPPPALTGPNDPTDPEVSFFGHSTKFDGLGVLFDASPSAPIHSRSDPKSYDSEQAHGAESSGVISGLLDDGSRDWLDDDDAEKEVGKDAAYIGSAIGECAGTFRNAAGLLWARISHYNNTIRCDLDLTPHTTLSAAGRDFAHHCWSMSNVNLEAGSYFGVSGLASGSTEPDTIDLYAIDVFEIMPAGKNGLAGTETGSPLVDETDVLEGTGVDTTADLAHEIFLSQALMLQAIDGMGRKTEDLAKKLAENSFERLMQKLSAIENSIAGLAAIKSGYAPNSVPPIPGSNGAAAPVSQSYEHVVQLQERLLAELGAFGRKLEVANGHSLASLATLVSRTAESLALMNRTTNTLDEQLPVKLQWFWISTITTIMVILAITIREKFFGSRRGKML